MIINVRGTSGSGKSFLVREVMGLYQRRMDIMEAAAAGEKVRRRPIGYECVDSVRPPLIVLGHYETACGGCDTITKMDRIFELVREYHGAGYHVLFEGLLISADVLRTGALHTDGLPLLVVAIDIPLADCLASVNARRAARGVMEPVNPDNTESKYKGVKGSLKRLTALGAATFVGDRAACLERVRTEFS